MPSSLIDVPQHHCGDVGPPELASLPEDLDRLPDPRRVRGRRYRLGSLLALCLLAVLGGASRPAGIARCAADAPADVRTRIGLRPLPRATTLGRLLSRLDGDVVDDSVGAWLTRHARDPADDAGQLAGVAVDTTAVRGSRTGEKAAVRLLAAVLHESQMVISQRQITTKSNEIPTPTEPAEQS
ncbi:transposase family protein [Streptomyces fractus]|uniref:transposase family protein n=1 Tax=Streptomyces fractus TaxID=641806 RepID=UPI003CF3A13F